MRIGITCLYTIFKYDYPDSVDAAIASLREIRSLGFRFLEMEGLGREHLAEMYRRRQEVRRVLDDSGLHVHNFCVVDPEMVNVDVAFRTLDCFSSFNYYR